MRLKRPDTLNVIPLIDVMLVLLVIVLVASTFIVERKMKINLPSSNSSEIKTSEQNSFKIFIDENNKLFLNEHEKTILQIKAELILLKNSDEVLIFADKNSYFGVFIDLVNILKEKGHENFNIITKHEE